MTDRTPFWRVAAGYDEQHERELVETIGKAIAEVSVVSDVDAVVIRTGGVASALLTCLAEILALSPSVTRTPTAMRKTLDELHRRLRSRVRAAERDPVVRDFLRRRCFNGLDTEGSA